MIKYVPKMSIFDHPPDVALVNPVNCVGVMGKGLALKFKKRWPAMFEDYHNDVLEPGHCYVYLSAENVINVTTKDHWRNPSRIEWVGDIIRKLSYLEYEYQEIAIPKLGCGLGGLHWPDVRALMVQYLEPLKMTCWVHGEPPG
jgi:O-acetyl-ADP-ribose deacetylase (regulator of RNase III)